MNELLRDFLTEAHENLDVIDVELVRFEREPNNADLLARIFRLVHTIKGTCGFLSLPRLETLTHAAETLMGRFREGLPVTPDAVSLILSVIDRIKEILAELDRSENEPVGDDDDLIRELEHRAFGTEQPAENSGTVGKLVYQVLERPLRADEVSLDELERAFREAPGHEETVPGDAERRANSERREDERRDGPGRAQSLRVQVDTLESLMTMVSELVLTRNQLLEIMRRSEDSDLSAPFQRLSNITGELQEGVMKTRMQPIGNAWAKLPRVVRDLAAELGKKIELVMSGEDTELDRQLLEHIKDPLTHMVRNSADHGIEMPEERLAAGKRETGTISLSAFHEGGLVIVEITDNGRGLDVRRIRQRAVHLGLVGEAEAEGLSDSQIYRFILAPGFSTAREVTSISGRGVGMDVVKSNIDQIGGALEIKSIPGHGTTLRIKIPLTLAIVSALIVGAEGERFAIPQIAVVELVRVGSDAEHRIERIRNASVLRLRDQLIPIEYLNLLLKLPRPEQPRDEQFVVMMQVGGRRFGIVVDQVVHTEEIVVKPMSSRLRKIPLFSGNTILGDGSVIMILDPNGVSTAVGGNLETSVAPDAPRERESSESGDSSVSLLVFRAGSREPKAVPISLITRLEQVDAKRIERSNGRYVMQYRGALMPLLPVNDTVQVRSEGSQPILVFVDKDHSMGLIVDEIVDIVENRLEISIGSQTPGVLGSAVIEGLATEVIDVAHYMPLAFEDWLRRSAMAMEPQTRRVMLVDDSAFFRNMLTPVLMAAGYEVKAVASGREAIDILERDTGFDYVICDIEMPEMNGFELAERLRTNTRTAGLRLIALSSLHSPAAVDRGHEAGFTRYVAKFDRGGLLAILKEPLLQWARAA